MLGPLTLAGKLELFTGDSLGVYQDLIDTFGLLGDPAMRLGLATTDLALSFLDVPAGELAQGDPVTLRLHVSNQGEMAAPNVVVEVEMPPLDQLQATSDLGPVTIEPGDPARFLIGDLDPGQVTDLVITGVLPATVDQTTFLLRANVASAWQDSDTANNQAGPVAMQVAAADLRVNLGLTPSTPLIAGQAFHFDIAYENLGVGTATGVVITLPLPSGVQGLSWTAADPAVSQLSADPLVFSAPDLAHGAKA